MIRFCVVLLVIKPLLDLEKSWDGSMGSWWGERVQDRLKFLGCFVDGGFLNELTA